MSDPLSPEQRAEVHAEFAAWLVKKAREYRATGSRQHALQADAIATLASKVARGAVRPDNLLSPLTQGGPEDEVAELLTGGERLSVERDRYRAAWQSARERATAHREGTLRQVATRDQIQRWLKEREAEVERLRAELDAERKRAAELREREAGAHDQLAAAVGVASSMVWPDLVARVAELAARPTRAEVLREAAYVVAGIDFHPNASGRHLDLAAGLAERLRRMATAARSETGCFGFESNPVAPGLCGGCHEPREDHAAAQGETGGAS